MIYNIKTQKCLLILQMLKFKIKLPANQYMKWNSVHICLLIRIKSKTTPANDIDVPMITANNFSCSLDKRT